jgi:hypothetical protein
MYRIDDSVGELLVSAAGKALEREGVDQAGWEDSCCDLVKDAWQPIITRVWSDLKDVRVRCRQRVYSGIDTRRIDDIDIVYGLVSTPLAVFEAKRWGRPALIAPDVRKLLGLGSQSERFLLFYGGFRREDVPRPPIYEGLLRLVRETWLPSLADELRAARARTSDVNTILQGLAFRLESPDLRMGRSSASWIRCHETPPNRMHPWYYTILVRVEDAAA